MDIEGIPRVVDVEGASPSLVRASELIALIFRQEVCQTELPSDWIPGLSPSENRRVTILCRLAYALALKTVGQRDAHEDFLRKFAEMDRLVKHTHQNVE